MSKPDPGSGAYAPRIRRSRGGWTWKARLALAVLAGAFAGAAWAQDYRSLDLALSRIIGEIVDDGGLRGQAVLVSPNNFIESGSGRNLRLSSLLARQSIPVLRRHGAIPVSGSDDEDRAVTLRGEWSIEDESGEQYLYLYMEAKQLVGNNELRSLASDHGLVPVASIDRRTLEPDIASHGRYVVHRLENDLERSIAGAGGRYRLHVRPFALDLDGMAQSESERFYRYLLGRWRPAFAGSRRLRLVGPAGFDGELHGNVFVVGGRIEVGLYIRDDQEGEVAAAFVEMDRKLFPSGLFGPDVRGALARCAIEVEAERLEAARACYEEVRAGAPGDPDVGEGVRAGLERIAGLEKRARVEAAVEEAIGRGELGEARRRLEDLRRLDADHPRLAEWEEEVVRAERRREDDEAFARAKAEGTVSALDGYLSRCGAGCGHGAEARRLRAEAEERERFPPGKRFRDCAGCPWMVVVPEGSFLMGSPESEEGRWDDGREGPVHRVRMARPFAVGVHEVTRGEFARFVSEEGRSMGDGCWGYEGGEWGWRLGKSWENPGFEQTDEHPVVCVSWEDARAYVGWLSEETGKEYRLLSESEWEYVARGGRGTSRYWGEGEAGQCEYANGADEALKGEYADWPWAVASCNDRRVWTSPVGTFEENGFGLHDVLGNVWEWVGDCYHDSYEGAPADGSAWESGDCERRVLRGGSWDSIPGNLRSAIRFRSPTGGRSVNAGFRVARTLTP